VKAVVLIDGAAYGPVALKVMTQAFDAAWSEIAPRFKGDELNAQSARLELTGACNRLLAWIRAPTSYEFTS
jgi:hypothetical protein